MITIVVAHDTRRGIGKDGWMPWDLPEDLKNFRKLTLHHDIVMGRVTFAAMKKPLSERHPFLITNKSYNTKQQKFLRFIHDLKRLLR